MGIVNPVLYETMTPTRKNNENTLEVERQRAQSTLILEAIRTGGTPNAACKNLIFFVGLGLLVDGSHTIADQCKSTPKGAPALPAAAPVLGLPAVQGYGLQPFGQGPFGGISSVSGFVLDVGTGLPLAGATVTVDKNPPVQTDGGGWFPMPSSYQSLRSGTELGVTVEKDGYETMKVKLSVGGLLVIDMHRKK
jgi:hypothetical protein